jgi:hypothetical protein
MNTTKKILLIISLSTLALSCLLLILQVFKVEVFTNKYLLRTLLISSTLAIGSGLGINALNVYKRKQILGIISLSLLATSTLFAVIIFASPLLDKDSPFNKLTVILSVFSVLFEIIALLYSRLNKKFFVLQLVTYIVICIIDVIISLTVCGVDVFKYEFITDGFIVCCICAVGLLIALTVLGLKLSGDTQLTKSQTVNANNNDMISVSKSEYENLKAENEKLKAEIESLKKDK